MPAANTLWNITFGDYAFSLDRKTLLYRLEDAKAGVVWADGLPLGWMELEERETGARTRVPFGEMRLLSLSEKASAAGKRILLGLDWNGVPVDVYVTCAEREIQLTVEASRDTRTHRVQDICLYPGLIAAPYGTGSYLLIPCDEGAIIAANDANFPSGLTVWDDLNMPFVGAVREADAGRSALAFLTDSAYTSLGINVQGEHASFQPVYQRDPERRRLDVRLVVLPQGDHVAIARAYRDKAIGERNHVTLRRKARERPVVDALLGSAYVSFWSQPDGQSFVEMAEVARAMKTLGVEKATCILDIRVTQNTDGSLTLVPHQANENEADLRQAVEAIQADGYSALLSLDQIHANQAEQVIDLANRCRANGIHWKYAANQGLGDPSNGLTRWDDMDARMMGLRQIAEAGLIVGSDGGADWSALGCDFWRWHMADPLGHADDYFNGWTTFAPLTATVYRDSVVMPGLPLQPSLLRWFPRLLRSLLMLAPPSYNMDREFVIEHAAFIRRTYSLLAPLHALTFSAFLTAHRFLTPDYLVEEAVYSDKTRVVINQGWSSDYEDDDVHLPPGGFYVSNARMTAHDALRVGEERFPERAWRIRQSSDGLPLAESTDVREQVFPPV